MKRHLVIFARTPQFGRVKRRLAAAVGPVAAMRFYRQTLDRQIRTLSRDRRVFDVGPDRRPAAGFGGGGGGGGPQTWPACTEPLRDYSQYRR